MKTQALSITMVGSPDDKGDVRLGDFLEFFGNALRCLRGVDRLVSGREKPSADYKIVGLKRGSATVQLEPIPYPRTEDYTAQILETFTEGLDTLVRGQAPPRFDRHLLETFKELAKPLSRRGTTVQIQTRGRKIAVSANLALSVERIIGEDITSEGSIGGYLDAVNVHEKNEFFIYPAVGGARIECDFPDELLEKVKEGIKRHVNASGTLRYKRNETFPYRIDIKDIEIYPPEEELPKLEDFRGVVPEITGELDSVAFVRKLRSEW